METSALERLSSPESKDLNEIPAELKEVLSGLIVVGDPTGEQEERSLDDFTTSLATFREQQENIKKNFPELAEIFEPWNQEEECTSPALERITGWKPGILNILKGSQPELMKQLEDVTRLKSLEDTIINMDKLYPVLIDSITDTTAAIGGILDEHPEWAEEIIENSGINWFSTKRMLSIYPELVKKRDSISERLEEDILPIYRNKRDLQASPYLRWEGFRVINDIYPGLLKDYATFINEVNKEVNTESWSKRVAGQYAGVIKNPELLNNLNRSELFFLGKALSLLEENMPEPHINEDDDLETASTKGKYAGTEKEQVEAAKLFVLYKAADLGVKDPEELQLERGLSRWFTFYERSFFGHYYDGYHWGKFEKALLLELLIRTAKDRREKGESSLEELLGIEDWDKQDAPEGYLERMNFSL